MAQRHGREFAGLRRKNRPCPFANPGFDTKVAHPAYASAPRHRRVLFDEADHNDRTAGDTATDLPTDDGPSTSAAGRAQGIVFSLGEGRVVVMGEAAELSAQVAGGEKFGMNTPGIDNRQMALNIMHWLSGLLEPRADQLR